MKKLYTCILFALLMCGCVSQQGYMAVVDLDFRKPEQIEAGRYEAEAPYKNYEQNVSQEVATESEVHKESLPFTWWELILNAVSKLECRVTLFQIRWADHRIQSDNK